MRGLLGYEVDAMSGGGPSGNRAAGGPTRRFPRPGRPRQHRYADMTMYTAASGALVFRDRNRSNGAGDWTPTMLRTLDTPRANAAAQTVHPQRPRSPCCRRRRVRPVWEMTGSRNPIVLLASALAIAFVLRPWIWARRMGGSMMVELRHRPDRLQGNPRGGPAVRTTGPASSPLVPGGRRGNAAAATCARRCCRRFISRFARVDSVDRAVAVISDSSCPT